MHRQTAKNRINRILRSTTPGLHRDEYWLPVQATWKALQEAGWDVNILDSVYRWVDGRMVEKVWHFEIINNMELNSPILGILTAHGAGTVADPLSKYDISAYVS